jgi:hypothetical protein
LEDNVCDAGKGETAGKCKKTTHILANTQAKDKCVYQEQESERYAQPRECRVEEEGMLR